MDDDMISENIDLANSDDGFADVERIELPVRYTRHDILIQELTRVEHVSAVNPIGPCTFKPSDTRYDIGTAQDAGTEARARAKT